MSMRTMSLMRTPYACVIRPELPLEPIAMVTSQFASD